MHCLTKKTAMALAAALIIGATTEAHAAFVDPSTTPAGASAFTNWNRTDTDTTYQQWRGPVNGGTPALAGGGENFTSLFGLNQPDDDHHNPNGTATAQFLDATRNSTGHTSGTLTAGSQNIYSFFASADFELIVPGYGAAPNTTTTVILQLDVNGNEILVGPTTPGNAAAPNSVKVDGHDWVDHVELTRTASSGGGFPTAAVTHWFRFELPNTAASQLIEFDTYDASFGPYVPSILDPQSTDDLMYGHTSIIGIAVDTFVQAAAIPGDLDGDGFVGLADLDIILNNWNLNVPPANPLADPTGDNFVGLADLDIVLNNWNAGSPPALPGAAAIPEPGALALLGAALTGLTGRRSRS